jgi:adenosylhomocysteine nucleosidase
MKLLLLCAFLEEKQAFLDSHPLLKPHKHGHFQYYSGSVHEHDIILICTGIGTTNAAIIATAFCETFKPDLILFGGTAGGLLAGQKMGDLVIADSILDIDLYDLPRIIAGSPFESCLNHPNLRKPFVSIYQLAPSFVKKAQDVKLDNITTGCIVTSNVFPLPTQHLANIKAHNSHAIEMESSGICRAAELYDTPVIIIRAISNIIDENGNDLGTPDHAILECSRRLAIFFDELIKQL